MLPEDPLLFMGIFTVTVVACNVLLAWRITRLTKTLSTITLKQSFPQLPEPMPHENKNPPPAAPPPFSPEQVQYLKSLFEARSSEGRGPGRPKGAKDTKPRKPYTRRQPTPSPETSQQEQESVESAFAWFLKQSESQQ
ncbi:MAG: hypothetical protein QXR76_03275 [Candidatus Bathyarchaeia archaeon]